MKNTHLIKGDTTILRIMRRGREYLVQVDTADLPLVGQYRWYIVEANEGYPYAIANRPSREGGGKILLHRLLLDAPPGMVVDHRNHDTLDNRRSNLRLVSQSENLRNRKRNRNNTSGYIGVSWYRQTRRWMAHITVNYRFINLGYYDTPEAAALARDEAALARFGEMATLNFPELRQEWKRESRCLKSC